MTMPVQIPQLRPQIQSPPVRKVPVSCCGYTSLQGIPKPWTCPACGTTIEPPQ